MINVYERIDPNGMSCDQRAVYEAYPYLDYIGAALEGYYPVADKQVWTDGDEEDSSILWCHSLVTTAAIMAHHVNAWMKCGVSAEQSVIGCRV